MNNGVAKAHDAVCTGNDVLPMRTHETGDCCQSARTELATVANAHARELPMHSGELPTCTGSVANAHDVYFTKEVLSSDLCPRPSGPPVGSDRTTSIPAVIPAGSTMVDLEQWELEVILSMEYMKTADELIEAVSIIPGNTTKEQKQNLKLFLERYKKYRS